MDFKEKYLKYKNKYIELKNHSVNYSKLQNGGGKDSFTMNFNKQIPYTFIKENRFINGYLRKSISALTSTELQLSSLTKEFDEFTLNNFKNTFTYNLSNQMLTSITAMIEYINKDDDMVDTNADMVDTNADILQTHKLRIKNFVKNIIDTVESDFSTVNKKTHVLSESVKLPSHSIESLSLKPFDFSQQTCEDSRWIPGPDGQLIKNDGSYKGCVNGKIINDWKTRPCMGCKGKGKNQQSVETKSSQLDITDSKKTDVVESSSL